MSGLCFKRCNSNFDFFYFDMFHLDLMFQVIPFFDNLTVLFPFVFIVLFSVLIVNFCTKYTFLLVVLVDFSLLPSGFCLLRKRRKFESKE